MGRYTPSSSLTSIELTIESETTTYKNSGFLGSVRHKSGNPARCSLSFWNAISHSSIYSNAFLSRQEKRSHLLVAFEMNQFNVVTLPATLCIAFMLFGDPMSKMAFTFFGLASIPLYKTINPRNFPIDTLKAHFSSFNLIWYFLRVSKVSLRS